jgi:drug/metabolite transporter (DMT)-like permease
VIWDSVPRSQFQNLAIRSCQGSLLILIQFTIVKYLSLIYIGVAQNCTPLVTVLMSYFMTGERVKMIDIVMILITFIGVSFII